MTVGELILYLMTKDKTGEVVVRIGDKYQEEPIQTIECEGNEIIIEVTGYTVR